MSRPAGPEFISVLSWNIHECIGGDDRRDPERIARVIRELDPDIVGLQEVLNPGEGDDPPQLDHLVAATGMQGLAGPTLNRGGGDYGNALLSRYPIREVHRLDLSYPDREPRGALDAAIETPAGAIRVIVTHLGLRPAERRFQVKRLVEALPTSSLRPVILIGDLNEWFPFGRPARWLHRHFGRSRALRTFPSTFPLLPLDRVHILPEDALQETRVIQTPAARLASDHLPVLARIRVR